MKQHTVHGIKLQTMVQNHVANIELTSDVAETFIKAHGTIGIEAPYNTDVQLDSGKIDFQPLVAIYAPQQAADVSGQTELHAKVHGPLADKNRVEAHLEIPTLGINYQQFQFSSG